MLFAFFVYSEQFSGSLNSPKQANTIAIIKTIGTTIIPEANIEDIKKYLHTNLKNKVSNKNDGKQKQIKNL